MSRRRREIAALVTLVALAAGCGGSDENAGPFTVTLSGWAAGDCDPAGSHGPAHYRVCYSSPELRSIDVLDGGRAGRVAVEDPPGTGIGHWDWAALSPDGQTFLATWSAECNVPIAFTFPAEGGRPTVVTGERDWTKAPESEALGWTTDGEPIVRLPKGACSTTAEEPGTYVFGDGKPRRVDDRLEPSLEPRDL
ncbi:MAG: hypothetical protein QOF45_710 [Gaiellaceae bacterium]|nr:hypothetical protein [Gaiellaceae bacterium]